MSDDATSKPVARQLTWVQVSQEVLDDAANFVHITDRWLKPWLFPDRPRWPEFVPLPRLAAWQETARVRRQRLRDAWSVLRGRDRIWTEEDEQW